MDYKVEHVYKFKQNNTMKTINWNKINDTQFVSYQFKMAAKYSKWAPK